MIYSSQYSISNEDISNRSTIYEYRTQSFPRTSTRESSFFRPSAPTLSTASSESNIYTISRAKGGSSVHPYVVRRHRVNFRCRPTAYKRHTNLDSKPLNWKEKLKLARIHYLNFPNVSRLVCVLLCLAWFIYVAYHTLKDYRQHDTVVHLKFEKAKTSFPPSLTICTSNLLDQFHDKSISKISALKLLTDDDTKHILVDSQQEPSFNNPYIEITCVLVPVTIGEKILQYPPRNCTDMVPVVVHMSEAKRCFTFFSDIYGEMTKAVKNNPELTLIYDRLPEIHIQVHGQYIYGIKLGKRFSGVYISLNKNEVIPDMTSSSFHQMFPKKLINIQYARRVEKLLPPPYPTKCFKYSPEHVSNAKISSEHIYRSRGECILQCLWKTLNTKCANMYSIYTSPLVKEEENRQNMEEMVKMLKTNQSLLNMTFENETSKFFKLCPKTNTSYKEYKLAKEYCLKACPLSCYSVTYNEDRVYTSEVSTNDIKSLDTFAIITWASSPEVNLRHQAKWNQADFLGSLGGDVHIILGISLLQLINYCIKMIESGELFPDTSIAAIIHWFANAHDKQ